MVSHSFAILFYLKGSRKSVGHEPIYLRVTIDGRRLELSTKRHCNSDRWNKHAGRAMGNKEDARILNAYLDTLERKVYEAQRYLIEEEMEVTVETVKNVLTGIAERPRMLLEIFQQHNDQMKALIGNGYAHQTHKRYVTTLGHTREFLQWKFKLSDIDIKKLSDELICDYEFFLRSVRKCAHNSTMKYLTNFKKIVLLCVKKDWLGKDPFIGFNLATKEVQKTFLTQEELDRMLNKKFITSRLTITRDMFLFSCYSGLAYVDIKNLKRSNISVGIDGEKWVFINRQKTETKSRIPLLPLCLQIMEKYKDHPQCCNEDRILPVWSNQKLNEYLKEIADVCNIQKRLTYHIARHTFATTITLNNGVPLETVSKMLGHKSLRATQHYAKILDKKISEDMQVLKIKLKENALQKDKRDTA